MIKLNGIVVTGVLITVIVLGAVQNAGCVGHCRDRDFSSITSGNYELRPFPGGHEWLDGALLTVDREAGTAKIRYTREGSTYEVTFTLDE